MEHSTPPSDHEEALFRGLLEGTLSSEQTSELNRLLQHSEAARQRYAQMMTTHALLEWSQGAAGLGSDTDPDATAGGPDAPDSASTPGPGRLRAWLRPLAIATALAAGLLVGATVGAWAYAYWVYGSARPAVVARVTQLWKPTWNLDAAPLTTWEALAEGQIVEITSGLVQIYFDVGAEVILQGPGRLRVVDEASAHLDYGDVTVRAEQLGFVLTTDRSEVIDLGTEFGLSVQPTGNTELVVFDGQVDLRYLGGAQTPTARPSEWRLATGEAVQLDARGVAQRIVTIGSHRFPRSALRYPNRRRTSRVITGISDNIRAAGAGPFYQIVHGGLYDDAPAYVDRVYEWNGVNVWGIPEFLRGADYVMMFNDDKREEIEIVVHLAEPANLFVFWDERSPPPEWLVAAFTKLETRIGMDEGPHPNELAHVSKRAVASGPGQSIDTVFSVWVHSVAEEREVTLGRTAVPADQSVSMYGIAAVATATEPTY